MSKERKAVFVIDANVKPFERGLRDAEGLMKAFEQKAAKSGGDGHGASGRRNTVGGVFSGAGGGGAAGTARKFFGGWMAAEAMEAAINSLTIGVRKHQLAQARATGDLDKMALATIKVNQAQEQLVSSFPVLGASISRLMRVIGSTEAMQGFIQTRAGQRAIGERQDARLTSITDEIEVLEAMLSGTNEEGILSIKQSQQLREAEKERLKVIQEQTKIIEEHSTIGSAWAGRMSIKDFEEFIDALEKRKSEYEEKKGEMTREERDYETWMITRQQPIANRLLPFYEQAKDIIAKANKEIEKANAVKEEEKREKELRLKRLQQEQEKRIADFIRDKEYEILQVKLNNELANKDDAWEIWHTKSRLLDLEEQFLVDKMKREKASQEEQDVVFRLFRQREESLYGERERALAKEREEEDKKRRDLQKRLNAHDNATTAAYVSMSGAVTNASAEQQTAKNTQELVKETRMTNRELRRLTQAQQAAHFGKQAVGFRRERLN